MGYLPSDANEVIIDAVLTKIGRQKLAAQGNLGITRFALSDDEIDYSLYNVGNPLGTDYYDTAIRMMPILEALPANTDSLKYKLFTNVPATLQQYVSSLSVTADNTLLGVGSSATDGLTGITSQTPYTITPVLSSAGFTPTKYTEVLNSIYYVATVSAYESYGLKLVTLAGDPVGTPTSVPTVLVQKHYSDLTGTNATQIQAAGKRFIFTVLPSSAILSPTTFGLRIEAVSPLVDVQQYSHTIYVHTMAASV